MMEEIAVFYVPCPNDVAKSLGESVLRSNLGACYNVLKSHAGYFWNGALEEDQEEVLIIKTTKESIATLNTFIEHNHPYELPCIGHWSMKVNSPYADWIKRQIEKNV